MVIFPDISEAVNQARAISTSLGAECWRKADCFSSIPLSSSFQAQLRSRQGGPGMRWRGGLEPLDGVTPQPPFPSARAPTARQGRVGGGGGGGGAAAPRDATDQVANRNPNQTQTPAGDTATAKCGRASLFRGDHDCGLCPEKTSAHCDSPSLPPVHPSCAVVTPRIRRLLAPCPEFTARGLEVISVLGRELHQPSGFY